MSTLIQLRKRILARFAILLCVLLAGCGSTPDRGTPVSDRSMPIRAQQPQPAAIEPNSEVARLLLLAQQSGPPMAQAYRLRAVDLLFQHGDLYRARSILKYVSPEELSPEQARTYLLISLEIAMLMGDGEAALEQLANPPAGAMETLDLQQQLRVSELRAMALDRTGQHLDAAMERIVNTASLTAPDGQTANHQAIWNSLMALPAATLKEQAERSPFSNVKGWLELAALNKTNQHDIDQQLESLDAWLLRHPAHPAALALPGDLRSLSTVMRNQPKKVTLLLPLTGPFAANVGIPIRDGFLAAYYLAMERGRDVPSLTIINTDEVHDFGVLYRQVANSGTEFIVGPFEKRAVQQLAILPSLQVPVLALNYVQGMNEFPRGLYQFGLSAQDEARSAAGQAWRDGHRFALSLTPGSLWGDSVAEAFRTEFESLGGIVSGAEHFDDSSDFKAVTARVLDIHASRARAARLRQILREDIEFIPRKREDANFLFLAALPRDARQIKPALDYHQARDLPVYATSHIYTGQVNARLDADLNGVRFCDIPWILAPGNELREQVERHWSRNVANFGRLYAMGADSFQLYRRIQQLSAFENSRFFGQTGALTLNRQGQIVRAPVWAIMQKGQPTLLGASTARSISSMLDAP